VRPALDSLSAHHEPVKERGVGAPTQRFYLAGAYMHTQYIMGGVIRLRTKVAWRGPACSGAVSDGLPSTQPFQES
jgi:hypothetical protein